MKIVIDDRIENQNWTGSGGQGRDMRGLILARHAEAANINKIHYPNTRVLIGIVPDNWLAQNTVGEDILTVPVLAAASDIAKQMVRERVAQMLASVSVDYPQEERDTWPTKLTEAKALLDGGDLDDTVYLKAVVAATGTDAKDLAKKVVAKAEAYSRKLAEAEAMRTFQYVAIDKAKSVVELLDIVG